MAKNTEIRDFELPNSPEAEKAIIGCILQDKKSLVIALEMLSHTDFYYDANREIFKAATELFNENTPVDIVTVSDRLTRYDKLDAVGGLTYLTSVATSISTTENLEYYAKIVSEKALLRELANVAGEIKTLSAGQDGQASQLLSRAEQLVLDISSSREQKDISPIKDIIMATYEEMVENSKNTDKMVGLDTGFDELNYRTGGFRGGQLILIGGRPAMGKSSLAVNIAETVAITNKKPVAIFNLEMPKSMIVRRIFCSQAYIDSQKILSGKFEGEDWARLGKVLDKIAVAPLYIDDSSSITVSEIHAKCQRIKQTHGLSLVVIDYLQLMRDDSRTESRQVEVASISRALKIMAKELDVPVIALTQLNRANEKRPDKRPTLSDIRESGAVEQDADMVMLIHRDDYYNPDSADKNMAEIIIAKHRMGETGTFKLGWQGKYTKFVNIEYHKEDTAKIKGKDEE
ncbi:MAG: replicative DNA helicase [Clostridia bacterium]|nr:replicative DNA helicase [Clostridia bacterium]